MCFHCLCGCWSVYSYNFEWNLTVILFSCSFFKKMSFPVLLGGRVMTFLTCLLFMFTKWLKIIYVYIGLPSQYLPGLSLPFVLLYLSCPIWILILQFLLSARLCLFTFKRYTGQGPDCSSTIITPYYTAVTFTWKREPVEPLRFSASVLRLVHCTF